MENKRVKKMICDHLDVKYNQSKTYGFFFNDQALQVSGIGGYAPDDFYEYYEDWEQGTVSLTANQLKGT